MFSRQNVHGKQTLLHHLLNIKRREAFPAVVIDSSQVSITLMNSKILIDKIQYFSWIFQEKGLIFTVSLLAKKILKKINGQLTYQKWWQENRLSPTDIRHHQAELKTWQYLPQISVNDVIAFGSQNRIYPIHSYPQITYWLPKSPCMITYITI